MWKSDFSLPVSLSMYEEKFHEDEGGSLIGASQAVQLVKNLPASAVDIRDVGLIPGSGRSPGEGNSNPPQYSCLENPMDRGAWWAIVRGVTNSRMRLSMHV